MKLFEISAKHIVRGDTICLANTDFTVQRIEDCTDEAGNPVISIHALEIVPSCFRRVRKLFNWEFSPNHKIPHWTNY